MGIEGGGQERHPPKDVGQEMRDYIAEYLTRMM